MITLISKWKLKNGCPKELQAALKAVAEEVEKSEPDTLAYTVHLSARSPLGPPSSPVRIPGGQQTEVVFFEIYKDAAAFSKHLNGPTFTKFRKKNIKHFYEDPGNPGWANADTVFLSRQSAFLRPEAG